MSEQNEFEIVFDRTNANWSEQPSFNTQFLQATISHMDKVLEIRGHVFLNEIYDLFRIPRIPEGQVQGWIRRDAQTRMDIRIKEIGDNTFKVVFRTQGVVYQMI